jgi:hypothetical protein
MRNPKEYNTINTPMGRAAVVMLAAYIAWQSIGHGQYLRSEIKFYRQNNWDFELDSGNPCWLQFQAFPYLGNLPIGKMKLTMEAIWFVLQPCIFGFFFVNAFT